MLEQDMLDNRIGMTRVQLYARDLLLLASVATTGTSSSHLLEAFRECRNLVFLQSSRLMTWLVEPEVHDAVKDTITSL